MRWDAQSETLQETAHVIGDETFRIVVADNSNVLSEVKADQGSAPLEPHADHDDLFVLSINSPDTEDISWSVQGWVGNHRRLDFLDEDQNGRPTIPIRGTGGKLWERWSPAFRRFSSQESRINAGLQLWDRAVEARLP